MRPKDICKVDFTVIGQRFREERDLNHFTRDYIAEVTGYSVKHIQDIENGKQMPEADFTLACCKLYHRDMNYFYPETVTFRTDDDPGKMLIDVIHTMSKSSISDSKRFLKYLDMFIKKFE